MSHHMRTGRTTEQAIKHLGMLLKNHLSWGIMRVRKTQKPTPPGCDQRLSPGCAHCPRATGYGCGDRVIACLVRRQASVVET